MNIQGIASFPTIFTPKIAKGATDAKYGISVLLPPNDPQIPAIQQAFNEIQAVSFPNGITASADVCWSLYDQKFQGKEYYDPRCSGWWVLSTSAKAEDKPMVVDRSGEQIIDPAQVYGGLIVNVHFGMSFYAKGKTGIGGWLNGVMSSGVIGSLGRLDNKPSAEQMFASVQMPTDAAPVHQAANGAVIAAPAPAPAAPAAPAAAPAPAAPAAPVYQMTATATATREAYHAANWTDAQLIAEGLMLPPNGVATSF